VKNVISTQGFISKYTHINFQKMARTESCPRVRERLLGIHNLMLGKNRIDAARSVGRNPEWLRSWILRYEESGLEGLSDKAKSGQPKFLTDEQESKLVEDIIKLQDDRDGGRITAEEIRQHIIKEYEVEYKSRGVYDLLYRLGLSWVSSRSKHPKSDKNKQKSFKQTFKARMAKIKIKKKEIRDLVSR
jgi:transposase